MKKKLFYLALIVVLTVTSINAQTKVWDLGGNHADWQVLSSPGPAISSNVVIDNLGLYPGPSVTNFGVLETSPVTFFPPDAYTSVNSLKLNGDGAAVSNMPTQRYLYFEANGTVTIKIWYKTGGAGLRTIYVTNGTNVITSLSESNPNMNLVLTTPPTNIFGNVYIYGDAALNIYKIEVNGPLGTTVLRPALGINTFSKENDVIVYTKDNKVLFSNIKSKTEVAVYSLTGALVKNAAVNYDSGIETENGIYIVKLKSSEGEKTTKVIVQ